MTEKWWLRAARQGNTTAQVYLSVFYSRGELGEKRRLARLKYMVPRLNAVAGYLATDAQLMLQAKFLDPGTASVAHTKAGYERAKQGEESFNRLKDPPEIERNAGYGFGYWGVFLKWDLANLVFHQEEAPFGRYFGLNNSVYWRLKFEVQRLFEERRRILLKMVSEAPLSSRDLIMLRMRLLELTATLNAHTDGLYENTLNALEKQSLADVLPR